METRGVKETLEFLNGVKIVAVAGKQIAADGIGADDFPKALALLQRHRELSNAVTGMGDIDDELKDLSIEELQRLGMAVVAAYREFQAA